MRNALAGTWAMLLILCGFFYPLPAAAEIPDFGDTAAGYRLPLPNGWVPMPEAAMHDLVRDLFGEMPEVYREQIDANVRGAILPLVGETAEKPPVFDKILPEGTADILLWHMDNDALGIDLRMRTRLARADATAFTEIEEKAVRLLGLGTLNRLQAPGNALSALEGQNALVTLTQSDGILFVFSVPAGGGRHAHTALQLRFTTDNVLAVLIRQRSLDPEPSAEDALKMLAGMEIAPKQQLEFSKATELGTGSRVGIAVAIVVFITWIAVKYLHGLHVLKQRRKAQAQK